MLPVNQSEEESLVSEDEKRELYFQREQVTDRSLLDSVLPDFHRAAEARDRLARSEAILDPSQILWRK